VTRVEARSRRLGRSAAAFGPIAAASAVGKRRWGLLTQLSSAPFP